MSANPKLLKWARESLKLKVEDVANKLKISPETVSIWESDSIATPTYPQLEKLAYEIYKRPLALFFLPHPPIEQSPEVEFRTLPKAELESLQKDTILQIRTAHAYQISLSELYEGNNPVQKKIWRDINFSVDSLIEDQAKKIRAYLGLTIHEQEKWKDDESALKKWRTLIEESGVFVFKNSFKQRDISGFCLKHSEFPIIYLNNGNTKTRQIFSLLHELAHLLLGINGISKDENEERYFSNEQRKIERYCNQIAAEVLIPKNSIAEDLKGNLIERNEEIENQCTAIAKKYGVSREAVLRRLVDMSVVEAGRYEYFASRWRGQIKPRSKGNWYASKAAYISNKFLIDVVKQKSMQKISVPKAAEYLGVKPKNYSRLESLAVAWMSV